MADPLSIISGVIGIITAAIQSSKVIFELVNDIKEGPAEIKSVSRDVHAFHAIIVSLNATLKEVNVNNLITCDEAMVNMIGNLAGPLKNCQVVLEELMAKIQKQLQPRLESKGFRSSTISVKWCLFIKSEIRGLQLRLEAAKSTLDAVTALCSIRLLAIGKVATSQSVKGSSDPAEACFTIRRLVEDSVGHRPNTKSSRRASHECLSLKRAPDVPETSTTPRRLIPASLTLLVQETQHAFMSEDPSLQRHLVRIYRELGEQRMQMQQLKLAIEHPKRPGDDLIMGSNCGMSLSGEFVNPVLDLDNAEDDDSTAVDIFFDCISRFSTDDSSSTIDRLHAKFSGSPDYCLESTPSFYPEQYSTESLFSEPLFIVAMKASLEDHRMQKYFLLYAEKPRKWRRIIVLATFSGVREQSAISQVSATDNLDHSCKILPKALQKFLITLLPRLELLSSVSKLSLSLREDESGQIVSESCKTEVAEDLLEKEMSDEDQILQDIEDMDCAKFQESQIMVKSRISSSYYQVLVETRECIERKAPFASAGHRGENGFQDFFNDLKLLNSLRNCAGIVQLVGVVLDETRRHLRSYLYESPAIMSLKRVITFANSRSETIPWPVREIWSSQIIKAVSEVHSKGRNAGVLELGSIGLKADGKAILTRLQTSQRHLLPNEGHMHMPPELRNGPRSEDAAQRKIMNYRTDIFQLGYILWLLAEHRSNVSGYSYAKSACTNFPRYMCSVDQVNLVELPACCGGIPPYFSDIIRECRSLNPRERPTAHELAERVPYTGKSLPRMIELVDTYAPSVNYFLVCCDACGALARNLHYHCNVCFSGNFDICPACVAQGIHCLVPEHRLVKRIMRNGRLVDGP